MASLLGIDTGYGAGYACPMLILYTDLDGTLLDQRTYSWDSARTALDRLRHLEVPLVFCTSKTRAETEYWRTQIQAGHPFIVENGGALYVPRNCFPFSRKAHRRRDGYAVIEIGCPYEELVEILRVVSAESRCRVRGFHDMSVEEVSELCGIPLQQAALAKQREYDEPFEILGSAGTRLLQGIEKHGKRWTRGGRFYHILGANDKARCVRLLTRFYRQAFGELKTIGLGDGLNDAAFLNEVDIPIIIKSATSPELSSLVRGARVTDDPGPEGWNRSVLGILQADSISNAGLDPCGSDSQAML